VNVAGQAIQFRNDESGFLQPAQPQCPLLAFLMHLDAETRDRAWATVVSLHLLPFPEKDGPVVWPQYTIRNVLDITTAIDRTVECC
jgi:hypothetical protein